MPFGCVMKGLPVDLVGVEVGVEAEVGEVALWGNHQGAVEFGEVGDLEEQVEDMRGVEIHQGVVHEGDAVGWKVGGLGGIPNGIFGSEVIVAELLEELVLLLKLSELLRLHEQDGGWRLAVEMPVVEKEI